MQKVLLLTTFILILSSCGSKSQPSPCETPECQTVKTHLSPLCRFKIELSPKDPIETLLSEDPFNLYDNKVEIPYRPTPENEAKVLPTFDLKCID